ncbi:MAG: heme exporter protein CcmD [Parahaliea sp.]
MYFDSVQALLTMGGHGPYVWAAYMITLAILALLLFIPLRRKRLLQRELAGRFRRADQVQARTLVQIQSDEELKRASTS